MAMFAKAADTAANYLNGFIAIMLFLVMPVIITLAVKYNHRMDAETVKQPSEDEPQQEPDAPETAGDAPEKD